VRFLTVIFCALIKQISCVAAAFDDSLAACSEVHISTVKSVNSHFVPREKEFPINNKPGAKKDFVMFLEINETQY